MALIIIIIITILILLISFTVKIYNNLIKLKNKVKNSWAHIDAQLQRRFDLIPNLVSVVKGYTEHEKQILDKVFSIRNNYLNATTSKDKLFIDIELNKCLKSLFVISNKYPELKSNLQFLKLQETLTEIEEDISYARQFYNDAVTIYNNKLLSFPNNIIASIFNFKEEVLFDAFKNKEIMPRINFEERHNCPVCGAVITHNKSNCEFCKANLN